jgi:hypothetical protein
MTTHADLAAAFWRHNLDRIRRARAVKAAAADACAIFLTGHVDAALAADHAATRDVPVHGPDLVRAWGGAVLRATVRRQRAERNRHITTR